MPRVKEFNDEPEHPMVIRRRLQHQAFINAQQVINAEYRRQLEMAYRAGGMNRYCGGVAENRAFHEYGLESLL